MSRPFRAHGRRKRHRNRIYRIYCKSHSPYRSLTSRLDRIREITDGQLEKVFGYLTPHQRQVLELRIGTKEKSPMPVIQIAHLLELSPSTIYNISRKAVVKIEKYLKCD